MSELTPAALIELLDADDGTVARAIEHAIARRHGKTYCTCEEIPADWPRHGGGLTVDPNCPQHATTTPPPNPSTTEGD